MGEAIYTLKATFSTSDAAKSGLEKIKSLLTEADKAYDFWQSSRDDRAMTAEKFWEHFKKNYPQVCEMLALLPGTDQYNKNPVGGPDFSNALAGKMSIVGQTEDIEKAGAKAKTVTYVSEVWHFANWQIFAEWCCKFAGANACTWKSDEGYKGKATGTDSKTET